MAKGKIKIANHEGVYVIKMEGDVRLTLCLAFDEFIEKMLADSAFCSAVFDLTAAKAIDSTTLGLMAKISIQGREYCDSLPLVISDNPSITRTLVSMGFNDIFNIVRDNNSEQVSEAIDGAEALSSSGDMPEDLLREKVLETHRLLMSLNASNRETFSDLVSSLDPPRRPTHRPIR
ncbi:MAG: anti-anti-sigma factor [Alteromonadaceae bacterium]|nr:MAG: anti-anti-sigma factor [Alteromonadaceae bacterium]